MNKSDVGRNLYMLKGSLAYKGYDWWWHSFTGYNRETGEAKAFFIEYYVCNPALGGEVPVLGQLAENRERGVKPAYAMIKAGAWGQGAKQIHNFYPIPQFSCPADRLEVCIGESMLTEQRMQGMCSLNELEAKAHPEYMSDAGEMSWDLIIDKQIAYHVGYGASSIFRRLNAFEMFWHAEGIKTNYSGTVRLDGVVYDIIPERSYGYADKNWGADYTSPWLWISSCHLRSLITGQTLDHSAVEVGGGRPKVFGIPLPRQILIGMYHEGTMYEYNFSKPLLRSRVTFDFEEGDKRHYWKVRASNHNSEFELELECPRDEMLLINYESPDGQKRHNRLWNGGTGYGEIRLYRKLGGSKQLIDHIELRNAGCEYGEFSD
ncbi:tocopherol cyclase family protein [Paenibacillus massiliensis]|uniref:tocopherol cyclase family protein n=1 Tax=Paenibacillus massiliensis TaxID=225917 RepID=UPI00035E8492|nr:tocopherol cyclase family protein [Paenibacillus massiliensis]